MASAENRKTVLVVEDEVFIRMCTVASLEDAGFCVLEARDSAEALEMLDQYVDISLMVTDVRMPGEMDGLGLVAQVQREHPVIRALVVSGNATAEQAFEAGAVGFLHKPYLGHSIVRAVRDMAIAA